MERQFYVHIHGTEAYNQTKAVFENHPSGQFVVVKTLAAADILVLTGGADIDPEIYGSKIIPGTFINKKRDHAELEAIKQSNAKIKIGICRGAQLLNCYPNKGTLWQDVDNHESGYHVVTDYYTNRGWQVNTVHHQMMRPGPGAELIAGTCLSKEKYGYEESWNRGSSQKTLVDWVDPEVIWYPDTKSLCFQPHPEYGHVETTNFFWELLDRYTLNKKPVIAA